MTGDRDTARAESSVFGSDQILKRVRHRWPNRGVDVEVIRLPKRAWQSCPESEDRAWSVCDLGDGTVEAAYLLDP